MMGELQRGVGVVPNREFAELGSLVVPYLMLVGSTLPILGAVRLSLGGRWLPRTPVAPRTWNLLHFLGFYVLFLFMTGTVSALFTSAGIFDLLYGEGRIPERSPATEAWGAVMGAAAGERAAIASKSVDQLKVLWASLVAVPLLLLAIHFIAVAFRGLSPTYPRRDFFAHVLLGGTSALVCVPAVLIVHVLTLYGHDAVGGTAVDHPIARLGAGSQPWETLAFWISVCVLIPWVEEVLFRGLLLRWAMSGIGAASLTFGLAFVFAAAPGFEWNPRVGPVGLVAGAALLAVGFHRFGKRSRRRTVVAVAATSALFAAAHSPVWPSPIPLFALGVVLAALTVRTGRITSAVVVHGFFNSVSFLYLLRTGPVG